MYRKIKVEAACFLSQANMVTLSYWRPEFFRMGSDIEVLAAERDRIMVRFVGGEDILLDAVFYYLGGFIPQSFLEECGVHFQERRALVNE